MLRLRSRGQLYGIGPLRSPWLSFRWWFAASCSISVRCGYDGVYQRLAAKLAVLDPSFKATAPAVPAHGLVTFATEGPSDPQHLEAATRFFRANGGFDELDLRRVSHRPPKNDDQLWKWLQKEKDVPNPFPRVGVFDADTSYALRLGAKGWEHLGNGVVAVALAAAPWLSAGQRVCIEMLYPPLVLASFDKEGRRLWLRSDFDEAGVSHDGRYQMQYPKKTTLVVEHVRPVGDTGKSVGLAKVAFADAVWRGQPPLTTWTLTASVLPSSDFGARSPQRRCGALKGSLLVASGLVFLGCRVAAAFLGWRDTKRRDGFAHRCHARRRIRARFARDGSR